MIWRAFKYILSGLLSLLAGFLLIVFILSPDNPMALGLSGFFVILAAMLWIDFEKPNRMNALLCIVVAVGFIVFGVKVFTGSIVYPKECSGVSLLFCELMNVLHEMGGGPAAAIPSFAIAIALIWGVIYAAKRGRLAQKTGTRPFSESSV